MDIPSFFEDFIRQVGADTTDPALDQAFSGIRDAFNAMGVGEITPRESLVALSAIVLYEGVEIQQIRVGIAAYLGTLLNR